MSQFIAFLKNINRDNAILYTAATVSIVFLTIALM
jgi:hypothetical protein